MDNASQTSTRQSPKQAPVILFDGTCAFCNFWSRFVLEYDHQRHFRLGRLQSDQGRQLCEHHGLSPDAMDSVVLIDGGQAYLRSAAMVRILARLPRPWRWLALIRWLPLKLRDGVYDFIGRHRYQWFGRYDHCPMPKPEQRDRFID
ncbi:thiol-disulfide oxidoreductase DCC family protein [Marinobacter nanhaiticus D15-8W]|uniref:Thiol-disulfide oxidoreductase DCC family protein n=1 Tax=Marinobacter nanhaiticus D15-8W TaxID=626887 RepID=N6W238_9GAMM|nr:thiol-disulfide oxidoreductase DCC family protein [Marinobacter nanhaiticus]ENO16600.1 thiol-disulfide oxidoreductase DCC family protein [Marinobacter nanhaiticus D15-8W]BES72397.1 thiol-disulfide oxidoreductase DCC family protein [Marinobacter nanhaiticus D15-8W]